MRAVHERGPDASVPGTSAVGTSPGGGKDVKSPSIGSTQRAGVGRLWSFDLVGDLATLYHPKHSRGGYVGEPDSVRFVHCAAVGCRLGEWCPLSGRSGRSVSVQVKGGVALTECLANGQGSTVGGNTVSYTQLTLTTIYSEYNSVVTES